MTMMMANTLECLADIAVGAGSLREAARLFGAGDALANAPARSASKFSTPTIEASVATLREALGYTGSQPVNRVRLASIS
jgi:hypothetical protein